MRADDGVVFSTSRYNFLVPVTSGYILYNARTGTSLRYAGSAQAEILAALCTYPATIMREDIVPATCAALCKGGFLLDPTFDELGAIRENYLHARREAPVIVTITTTNNCNLGCFYCFQKRDASALQTGRIPQIIKHIRTVFDTSKKRTLHVDWYGGEPMLNRAFLEETSIAIQALCAERDVAYSASMLTNGTLWPDDARGFVTAHRIERLQITFDGLAQSHNKTRHYRAAYTSPASQFDEACRLVDDLCRAIHVDLRFNLSPQNSDEAVPFAKFALQRGWFSEGTSTLLQLAKLTPYSKEVDFLHKLELSYIEFENVRNAVRAVMPDDRLDRSAALDRYPEPRESVCAAIANDSIVIGADGNLYNCGLQVTETHRAVGTMASNAASGGQEEEAHWWNAFDPTRNATCSTCSFLPVCWGSCPKLHLENDRVHLAQQSEYWRSMLPRRLAASLDLELVPAFAFTERHQFRV